MMCNRGTHEIRGPSDRGARGECAFCIRDRGRRHAAVRAEALALYRALEVRGLPVDVDRLAAGHELLTVADVMRDPLIP